MVFPSSVGASVPSTRQKVMSLTITALPRSDPKRGKNEENELKATSIRQPKYIKDTR